MTLSRRSFLKVAGLTVVAAAGASMFTGCSTTVFTTPVTYEADATNTEALKDLIDELNKNNTTKAVPGGSNYYSNKDNCKKAVENQLNGAKALNSSLKTKLEGVEVQSAALAEKKDEKSGKTTYYIKAILTKKSK